jgi:hypothetical protein
VAGLDGSAIRVDDNESAATYQGTNVASQPDPATAEVTLVFVEDYFGGAKVLTAGANTGIVADDDGGTWAGVTNLALPFP